MSDAKFKRLEPGNWLTPDPAQGAFGEVNLATGEHRDMTGDRWAKHILAVDLSDDVPEEVRELWEIARGVLLYGWFFYPLYALGDEQLHRVADTAVLYAYRRHGGPEPGSGPPNFHRRLQWLFKHGKIDKSVETRWSAIRALRNFGSHAEMVRIAMPIDALRTLQILGEEIDKLFARPQPPAQDCPSSS